MNNKETFIISLKDKQFLQGLVNAGKQSDKTKGKVEGLSGAVSHLRGALAGVSIGFLGREIINTLADFERFEAVLTNTLGSNSAAKKAIEEISDFAAKTPFAVDQLTDSYVKLANQGFVPTQDEMRKLGDLASSTGKDFDQLTEALIDGQVGEFERLKEFGIRAKKEGDKVQFTFKGVKTQVDFTESAMRNYILSLGDAQGVSGAMAAISKTTGGQISNLGDAVTQLFLNIGTKLKPVISATINVMGQAVTQIGNFVDWLAEGGDGVDILATAIGALGGAILTYNIIQKAQAAWTAIVTGAQWLLNAALTANPIGIVVVAIGALVAAFVVAWNSSEKFRGVIKGLWESMKVIGNYIYDHFRERILIIGKVFEFVKNKVVDAFTKVKSFIMGVLDDIMSFLRPIIDFVSKSIGGLFDSAKDSKMFGSIKKFANDVGGAFKKGFNDEIDRSKKELTEKEKEEEVVNRKLNPTSSTGGAGGTGKQKGLGAGISEIKASAPKTFNINIGSLIKEQTISTTNLQETSQKIKEAVTKVLLTAVNDAQVIAE